MRRGSCGEPRGVGPVHTAAPAGPRGAPDRLVNRIAHWNPERWTRPAGRGSTRAKVVHELVQRLADLTTDVEGEARRPVPRLDNDLALVDQLRVVAADLLLAGPSGTVLIAATELIESLDLV